MNKHIWVILLVLLVGVTGCAGDTRAPSRAVSELVERGPDVQNVQVTQSQILPPYGTKVLAQVAILELRVSTSRKGADEELKDLTEAIDHIALLASENEAISLEETSINQVGGSYTREEVSTSHIQNLDTSAITLKLATDLAENGYDLLESVVDFNDFLTAIDLPETITVQALSVETKVGDLEEYRSQLIDRVYRDLDLVQEEYGRSVKFEVTGLYDPLKMMRLSDTEYYIYLEPVVNVTEF
jgi:hypothetical protein